MDDPEMPKEVETEPEYMAPDPLLDVRRLRNVTTEPQDFHHKEERSI